ncbi:MAG: ATP12 family protein [Pseudomonadota bacterium]
MPKRFYKSVGVAALDTGWSIELDGRRIKTPGKVDLSLPSETLAEAVAAEWRAQGETIDLQSMALTRLANVAIDRTPSQRDAIADEIARYAETDVTCYLCDGPMALRARQDEAWSPWRTWAGQTLNVVLVPVEGVLAIPQPAASLQAVRQHVLGMDDFQLTGVSWACSLLGSAVLALACEHGALDVPQALLLSCIDEDWQIEQWGEDDEARLARDARKNDAAAVEIWFRAGAL